MSERLWSMCRSVCREMMESSIDNEFSTFDVRNRVLATLLKTSITSTYQIAAAVQNSSQGPSNSTFTPSDLLPQIFAACWQKSFLRRCFCPCQTLHCHYYLGLPHWSMRNQDDGFTLPVRQFCCIRNLSTVIYTWDDKFSIWISLLHSFCDRYTVRTSLPIPRSLNQHSLKDPIHAKSLRRLYM